MFQRTPVVKIFIMVSLSVWKRAYSEGNLALGKPVLQTGTWHDNAAERSVDGNRNGNFNAGSCSHTAGTDEPWWLVDLMGVYLLHYVVIYNRNSNPEQLDNTYVEGFLHYPLMCDQTVSQLCAHHPGPSEAVVNLTCVQEVRARYIRLKGTGHIHVCEVEVYGETADECSKRIVRIEKQDGRHLPYAVPTLDLGHAKSSRDCSYLCLQRPDCHVYNYNNLTGECKVPQKLFNSHSVASMDWTLYFIC